MSARSSSVPPPPADRPVRRELFAAGWELFSALLFVYAVVPATSSSPETIGIFLGSLLLSALVGPPLLRRGSTGLGVVATLRVLAWSLAAAPLVPTVGPSALVAAVAFGLMAGGMRRAMYRRFAPQAENSASPSMLRLALRARLAESAVMAGIVGGHVLMLFCVAFLRTESPVLFKAWFEIVPVLAVLGTVGFTLAVRPTTRPVLVALEAGPSGDRSVLLAGLAQALRLPDVLSYLNFVVWSAFTAGGVFYARPGPWSPGDAASQIGLGALFAFGVSFYQRAWHLDTVQPVVELLRAWTDEPPRAEGIPLQQRMMRDFGLPLLFSITLSLLASIGLYRALGGARLGTREDIGAVGALFASFGVLVIAAGGLVVRAARDLSRPMTSLARAADRVASGELDAAVSRVAGPNEVVGLGESIERMRVRLAGTIAELERERAGLEANVEARTAELTRALAELKRTQAALVQGERLASIGELSAGVAHEIYNPLSAIAGSAAPLERVSEELGSVIAAFRAALPELPEARRKELERVCLEVDVDASLEDLVGISQVIRRASDRSVRIVANLKSFSRASGEAVPTDLAAGIEETLVLLGPRLRAEEIEVEKRYEPLPEVICRAGEMNQVFMNLLINAIHALEGREDGAAKRIVIETRAEGKEVVVAVTDNGPGVPEEVAERIFDPFFTTKPRGQGTGLGLSISTDIARRHGGGLSLERPAGGGARFVCRVPVRVGRG
jgi:signal transduction histidine kinase